MQDFLSLEAAQNADSLFIGNVISLANQFYEASATELLRSTHKRTQRYMYDQLYYTDLRTYIALLCTSLIN